MHSARTNSLLMEDDLNVLGNVGPPQYFLMDDVLNFQIHGKQPFY